MFNDQDQTPLEANHSLQKFTKNKNLDQNKNPKHLNVGHTSRGRKLQSMEGEMGFDFEWLKSFVNMQTQTVLK